MLPHHGGGCRDVSNLDELINNLDPFLVLVHVRSRLKLFKRALQSIKTCESHFEISLPGMFIVTYRYILFKGSQKLHHV